MRKFCRYFTFKKKCPLLNFFKHKYCLNLALIIMGSILALLIFTLIFEIYLRFFNPNWKERIFFQMYNNQYLDVIPENGKVISKNINGEEFFEYVIDKEKEIVFDENSINARGEIVKNPKNKKRIIVMGCSIDFGSGVEYEQSYPYLLEKKINEFLQKEEYDVINVAVPGICTTQNINKLKYYFDIYQPNLLIFNPWAWQMSEKSCLKQLNNLGVSNYFFNLSYINNNEIELNYFKLPQNIHLWLSKNLKSFDYLNYFIVGINESKNNFFDPTGEITKQKESDNSDFAKQQHKQKIETINNFLLYLDNKNIPTIFPIFTSFDKEFTDMQISNLDLEIFSFNQKNKYKNTYSLFMLNEYLKNNIKKDDIALDTCCHFNQKGNELVAEIMLKYFIKEKIIQKH